MLNAFGAAVLLLHLVLPISLIDDDDDPDSASESPPIETVGYMGQADSPRGVLYVKGGYGYVGQTFNSDWEKNDWATELRVYNLYIAGHYMLAEVNNVGLGLGANIGLSKQVQELPTQDYDDGFNLQNINLFGLAQYESGAMSYEGRLGFLIDQGPTPSPVGTPPNVIVPIPNTDLANAAMLGGTVRYEASRFRVYADASYYLTFDTEYEIGPTTVETNPPNQLGSTLGGAVTLGPAEVGAALVYRQAFGVTNPQTGDDITRVLLGISPFVRVDVPDAPVEVFAGAATQDEHYDYGISIAGKNTFAPGASLTLGVAYEL